MTITSHFLISSGATQKPILRPSAKKKLGKRADINHIRQRQGLDGGNFVAPIAQRTVWVVFDEQSIIIFNDRRDFPATFQGNSSAGRVLKGRHQVNELYPTATKGHFKGSGN
jgi:hypothetical protein